MQPLSGLIEFLCFQPRVATQKRPSVATLGWNDTIPLGLESEAKPTPPGEGHYSLEQVARVKATRPIRRELPMRLTSFIAMCALLSPGIVPAREKAALPSA